MKYRIYIDEVGNADLGSSDNPNHRFLSLTGVILDLDYVRTTQTWRYDPYHYCLAVLLERYIFFLNQGGAAGDVLAESRGGREDRRLKDAFERLWAQGTEYVGPEQFRKALSSRQLKAKAKANNIAGLQLADLVAHPSRNEILREQGALDKELAPFARKVVEVLARKYYQRGGKVFGKKFL